MILFIFLLFIPKIYTNNQYLLIKLPSQTQQHQGENNLKHKKQNVDELVWNIKSLKLKFFTQSELLK